MIVRIPHRIMIEILRHARDKYPAECCGILAGRDGIVTDIYKMPKANSKKYFMDPRDQFKAFRDMKSKKIEMISIYYSSPHSTQIPSEEYDKLAFYPNASCINISLQSSEASGWDAFPEVELFWVKEGDITNGKIEVF